ncbi:extracellular solute-binding protein [Brachyspira sp.]|uniref:extracellular solute-binding protein n=1 Tax=Brachyspira sp. TaxID=1977261 RepID=UPI00263144DB|nr:extracellular solute-binding protein [Brachyspira sp.]
MRKIISFFLVLLPMMFFIFSCSGNEKSENSITVMVPDWAVPSDEMLNAFTADTGITVNMNVIAWENIRDKISIAAAGGTAAADVVEVDWSWVGEFNSADWLEPIELSQEEIDAMPSIKPFIIEGNVLALPYANDFRLAYYNKKHFDAAGIKEAPKSWDEVYAALKTIKDSGITKYPFSMPLNADESCTTSLIWMAYSKYGVVFNEDSTLNKDAVLGALQFINQMINVDNLIDPACKTSTGMDAYRRINSAEASFIVGPTSFVSRVQDPNESQVVGEVVPILLPGANGPSPKTFALPEGVGVIKLSKNKESAMKFVKWFNSAEIQKQLNYVQNTMPTRIAVMEDLINEGKLKNTGALLEESALIDSPFPNGIPSYYSEMTTAIFNAVNEMVLGVKTPEEAFNTMDTKIKQLVAAK